MVHGPLSLILMVDFWREAQADSNSGVGGLRFPRKVTYRATSPLYVGERVRLELDEALSGGGGRACRVVDAWGKVAMKGLIEG